LWALGARIVGRGRILLARAHLPVNPDIYRLTGASNAVTRVLLSVFKHGCQWLLAAMNRRVSASPRVSFAYRMGPNAHVLYVLWLGQVPITKHSRSATSRGARAHFSAAGNPQEITKCAHDSRITFHSISGHLLYTSHLSNCRDHGLLVITVCSDRHFVGKLTLA
jgi:hypothetical protein